MAKQTARTKRVEEIDALRFKLPETDFQIEISDNQNKIQVSSYGSANSIIMHLLPELSNSGYHSMPQMYVFASFATDKAVTKKLKISISSLIHKNYKAK